MWIKEIKLQNFRNYEYEEIEFNPRINILWGGNGQGKTNIIEALYLICISKSFRARSDRETILFGKEFFNIEAKLIQDNQIQHTCKIYYAENEGKKIYVDKKRIKKMVSFVGAFPIVLLIPSNQKITFGPPAERRRFLDSLLSQVSNLYLSNLIEFKKILKQRNKLLSQKRVDINMVKIWEVEMVKKG